MTRYYKIELLLKYTHAPEDIAMTGQRLRLPEPYKTAETVFKTDEHNNWAQFSMTDDDELRHQLLSFQEITEDDYELLKMQEITAGA